MPASPPTDGFDPRHLAHDLRHLLGLIRGHAELLARDWPEAGAQEGLRSITAATERATGLVEDLLRFGAGEADTPTPLHEDFRAAELLESIHGLCVGAARAAGASLELRLATPLPPALGDVDLLQRAVLNLVWNALEQVPALGGHVQLEAEADAAFLRLAVRDNGPGLPAAYCGDLTALRPQGEGAWPRDTEGRLHGFGLLIAALVARRHRGRLLGEAVSQDAGGGARVVLELPLAP